MATNGLLPDLTLVLDVSAEAARARVGPAATASRIARKSIRQRVRDGFRRTRQAYTTAQVGFARIYPAPVVLIDAQGDPDTGFAQIKARWSVSWHSVRGHDRIVTCCA